MLSRVVPLYTHVHDVEDPTNAHPYTVCCSVVPPERPAAGRERQNKRMRVNRVQQGAGRTSSPFQDDAGSAPEAVDMGEGMERAESHGHASSALPGTSLLQQATEAITSTIGSASRTLSGMLDLNAVSEMEARERERGTTDALKMLQHASMIVQMENEDFIEEHVGMMEPSGEAFPYSHREEEGRGQERVDEEDVSASGAKFLPGKDAYAGLWPVFASRFWIDALLLILLGAFLGLACIGYQYAITSGPRAYLTVDNPGYPLKNVGFGEGQLWWCVLDHIIPTRAAARALCLLH